MPPRRDDAITSLAAILEASGGDLSENSLRPIAGSTAAKSLIAALDEHGLIRRVGARRKRVLTVSLPTALRALGDAEIPPLKGRCGLQARDVAPRHVFRILHDPAELYRRGAEFPIEGVLFPHWNRAPFHWAKGTRFLRLHDGQPQGEYVSTGRRVIRRRPWWALLQRQRQRTNGAGKGTNDTGAPVGDGYTESGGNNNDTL